MVRKGNNLLQVCKQLAAITKLNDEESTSALTLMREAMGVLQHHDAVSGTAKQAVTFDYAQRLHSGIVACESIISKASIGGRDNPILDENFQFCHSLNISQCHVTEENNNFVVNVYNPLSREISRPIRLPVMSGAYVVSKISETQNLTIPSQLVPIPKSIYLVPGRDSGATNELIFMAVKVPPLGNQRYHVSKTSSGNTPVNQISTSFLVSIEF